MFNTTTGLKIFCTLIVVLCIGFVDNVRAMEKSIRISCSAQVAEAFGKEVLAVIKKDTGLKVPLHVFSSKTCLDRLMNGFTDLATTTQGVPYRIKQLGYVEIPFCRDPLAVIVQTNLPVGNLSERQLRKIFDRRITNWKTVGGPDLPIILIIPGEETGAYVNFKRQVMRIDEIHYDFMTEKSTMAIAGVQNMPGAISFVAQGATKGVNGVKCLKINGVPHTASNYICFQTFSFVTKGKPNEVAREIINFALSKKGLKIMNQKGMIPIIK